MKYEEINRLAGSLKQIAAGELGWSSFPDVTYTLSDDISAVPINHQTVTFNLQANLPNADFVDQVVDWLNHVIFNGYEIAEPAIIASEDLKGRRYDHNGGKRTVQKEITRVAIDICCEFSKIAEGIELYNEGLIEPLYFRWDNKYNNQHFGFNDLVMS
jgi:hypothetical protein